jgi:hypothetical protein
MKSPQERSTAVKFDEYSRVAPEDELFTIESRMSDTSFTTVAKADADGVENLADALRYILASVTGTQPPEAYSNYKPFSDRERALTVDGFTSFAEEPISLQIKPMLGPSLVEIYTTDELTTTPIWIDSAEEAEKLLEIIDSWLEANE